MYKLYLSYLTTLQLNLPGVIITAIASFAMSLITALVFNDSSADKYNSLVFEAHFHIAVF